MKIYIGSDHRGFELKQKLTSWLKSQNHEVIDCGPEKYDPLDDYVDYAGKLVLHVTSYMLHENVLGILLCGTGIGMTIAANRHTGVRCALGFDVDQVRHGRQNDNINCLSIPSEFVDETKAREMITVYLQTKPKMEEKYLRRIQKLDE